MAVKRADTKRLIIDGLLWCALVALLIAGFINLGAVKQYSSASLRYNTPISGQTAYAARLYSVEHSGDNAYWPTFWAENTATLDNGVISTTSDCIAYSGDASLVWPATYIKGAAPGVLDGTGCAVSEALAWRIWGSADVVGATVDIDGEWRVVRGVFKGDNELALISYRDEDKTQSWNAVELSGGPADAVRADAQSFATAAGLGKPESIHMGGASTTAAAMSILPLLILAFYGLSLVVVNVRRSYPIARTPVFYLMIIVFAVAMPVLLGALPAWTIPTRWSDFSFWASLLGQVSSGLREFLQAAPLLRDVELRVLILKQAGIAFFAVCFSLSVCFRWQMRREG